MTDADRIRRPGVFRAATAYFGLVFATGFLLGAIRVALLVPRLGVRTSELLEMPLMLAAIILSARFVVRRFAVAPSPAGRLTVGCIALAILLLAEMTVAFVLQGQTPLAYIAHRDAVSGTVYLAMLALFALMPSLVLRSPGPRP